MAQVQSTNVIKSLQRQLSEAHLKIAMLEAEMDEMRAAQPPIMNVPADAEVTGIGQE